MRVDTRSHHAGRIAGITAAATVALAITFGGAAGVASASARTEHRPTQAAYVRRADQICAATVRQTDAIVESLGFSPSDSDARRAARRIVRAARQELREVRALTPPKGDAQQVEKIYDAVDAAFDRIEARPSRLFDEPGPLARATRLARAYGLDVCGRG